MKDGIFKMYYAAILCPKDIDDKVLRLKNWMKDQFGCVVALKSRAHITMIPPFWLEEEKETGLVQTLQSFTSETIVTDIETDNFSHFDRKVLFIKIKDNPGLAAIRTEAEWHFRKSFSEYIKKDLRPFHPHITIANRDLRPGDFIKAWEVFSKKEFKESFPAQTISLLKLSFGKWNEIGNRPFSNT